MAADIPRDRIEQALRHPWALIPRELEPAFEAYQLQHYRRFLFNINLLAQLAYWSFGFADLLVLPDIGFTSLLIRSAFAALTLPIVFWCFRHSRNVRLLDLLLPVLIFIASVIWYEILAHSSSPLIPTYFYASVIFIVLANLSIQVRFLPALVMSVLITAYTLLNAYRLNAGDLAATGVFALVSLPVLMFSLFNSWSTTADRRQRFLRAQLEAMNADALAQANLRLEEMVHTDCLTGVANRRHFEHRAHFEIERHKRHQAPLCVMTMDVDHFKLINDTHGHATGDQVLQSLAMCTQNHLRENDLLARYGGEEFNILLPDTTLDDAIAAAERLRQSLAHCAVIVADGPPIHFTVSVGVAPLEASIGSLDTTLRLADRALYLAKDSGRNRVCSSRDLPA